MSLIWSNGVNRVCPGSLPGMTSSKKGQGIVPPKGEKQKYLIGVILDPILAVFKFWFHEIFASTIIIN